MAYRNNRNVEIHERINRLIRRGEARVVDEPVLPSRSQLVDRLISNYLADMPLFNGISVYRGTKDPDVDVGSFGNGSKHGTIHFDIARGYAETANAHIGVPFDNTWGVGMLAEYAIPEDAVFHQNFGLEDAASGKALDAGLTINQAEAQLRALVVAAAHAVSVDERQQARNALLTFCQRSLYELAIPAGQKPLRQWVVELDKEGIRSRLIENEDHGALADVMIDIVRDRKHAVDQYAATQVLRDIKGVTDSNSDVSGIASSVADRIGATLADIRKETFDVNHDSLSAAIQWRRNKQSGMHIARLTNSDTQVNYDDHRLQRIGALREAVRAIQSAEWYESTKSDVDAASSLITAGKSITAEREALSEQLLNASALESKASGALDRYNRLRDDVVARLDTLRAEELDASSRHFASRLLSRLGRPRERDTQQALLNTHLSAVDRKLEKLYAYSGTVRTAMRQWRERKELLDGQVKEIERALDDLSRNGYLGFLPEIDKRRGLGLNDSDWDALSRNMRTELRHRATIAAAGREAVSIMQKIAEHGFEHDESESIDRVATRTPSEQQIGDEDLVGVLVDAGEDPTAERVAELRAAFESMLTSSDAIDGLEISPTSVLAVVQGRSARQDAESPGVKTKNHTHSPVPQYRLPESPGGDLSF